MTLISETQILWISTSGDNFWEKKWKKNWSERFVLKVYIVVCYFSLIIFSTVELTSFATRFARHKLCSLLYSLHVVSCAHYYTEKGKWVLAIIQKKESEDKNIWSRGCRIVGRINRSGFLKIPKAESAGHTFFFPVGRLLWQEHTGNYRNTL